MALPGGAAQRCARVMPQAQKRAAPTVNAIRAIQIGLASPQAMRPCKILSVLIRLHPRFQILAEMAFEIRRGF
jgi:hypothetical protein